MLERIGEAGSIFYLSGLTEGIPEWSETESDAIRIIDTTPNPGDTLPDGSPSEGCIGEVSVHYSEVAEAWLALTNCGYDKIQLWTANTPWGPWSEEPTVLFDAGEDEGYCHFMHVDWDIQECDNVQDPGRDRGVDSNGHAYGPYVLERFTTGDASSFTLYYVMSTWNTYNVHVMTVDLQRL